MPGVKISALTETTSPQTTDEFVVQRGGSANYRLKLTNIPLTSISTTGLTAGKPLQVNSGGTAVESASDTGTGAVVRTTSPTISSPTISGHATIEGVTATGATGTGKFVFDNSPTLITPALGTPASGDLQNCIGGIYYKGSTTLEGQDGKTITHNKGDTNYYVLVSPKDVVIPNIGDIWVVKSSNTAVVYNSGISGISADISIIKTA